MDALALLTGDHNRVRGLFTRFKSAKETDDLETMRTLAAKIVEELKVHTTIEEEVFYPEFRDENDEIHATVTEGVEEHRVANRLLEEIDSMEPDTEHWAAKVNVLIENVEHHAEEEESEMFPEIRKATDAARLESIAQRMEARKAELGAPTMADKDGLTKERLAELAREQEIPGRSSMSTEELAAAVDPR